VHDIVFSALCFLKRQLPWWIALNVWTFFFQFYLEKTNIYFNVPKKHLRKVCVLSSLFHLSGFVRDECVPHCRIVLGSLLYPPSGICTTLRLLNLFLSFFLSVCFAGEKEKSLCFIVIVQVELSFLRDLNNASIFHWEGMCIYLWVRSFFMLLLHITDCIIIITVLDLPLAACSLMTKLTCHLTFEFLQEQTGLSNQPYSSGDPLMTLMLI